MSWEDLKFILTRNVGNQREKTWGLNFNQQNKKTHYFSDVNCFEQTDAGKK